MLCMKKKAPKQIDTRTQKAELEQVYWEMRGLATLRDAAWAKSARTRQHLHRVRANLVAIREHATHPKGAVDEFLKRRSVRLGPNPSPEQIEAFISGIPLPPDFIRPRPSPT